MLLKGQVRVTKNSQIIGTLGSAECFGEMALLADDVRSASIMAAQRVLLWKITGSVLETASSGSRANFYRTFLNVMMSRLDERTQDVSKLRASLENALMLLGKRGDDLNPA